MANKSTKLPKTIVLRLNGAFAEFSATVEFLDEDGKPVSGEPLCAVDYDGEWGVTYGPGCQNATETDGGLGPFACVGLALDNLLIEQGVLGEDAEPL